MVSINLLKEATVEKVLDKMNCMCSETERNELKQNEKIIIKNSKNSIVRHFEDKLTMPCNFENDKEINKNNIREQNEVDYINNEKIGHILIKKCEKDGKNENECLEAKKNVTIFDTNNSNYSSFLFFPLTGECLYSKPVDLSPVLKQIDRNLYLKGYEKSESIYHENCELSLLSKFTSLSLNNSDTNVHHNKCNNSYVNIDTNSTIISSPSFLSTFAHYSDDSYKKRKNNIISNKENFECDETENLIEVTTRSEVITNYKYKDEKKQYIYNNDGSNEDDEMLVFYDTYNSETVHHSSLTYENKEICASTNGVCTFDVASSGINCYHASVMSVFNDDEFLEEHENIESFHCINCINYNCANTSNNDNGCDMSNSNCVSCTNGKKKKWGMEGEDYKEKNNYEKEQRKGEIYTKYKIKHLYNECIDSKNGNNESTTNNQIKFFFSNEENNRKEKNEDKNLNTTIKRSKKQRKTGKKNNKKNKNNESDTDNTLYNSVNNNKINAYASSNIKTATTMKECSSFSYSNLSLISTITNKETMKKSSLSLIHCLPPNRIPSPPPIPPPPSDIPKPPAIPPPPSANNNCANCDMNKNCYNYINSNCSKNINGDNVGGRGSSTQRHSNNKSKSNNNENNCSSKNKNSLKLNTGSNFNSFMCPSPPNASALRLPILSSKTVFSINDTHIVNNDININKKENYMQSNDQSKKALIEDINNEINECHYIYGEKEKKEEMQDKNVHKNINNFNGVKNFYNVTTWHSVYDENDNITTKSEMEKNVFSSTSFPSTTSDSDLCCNDSAIQYKLKEKNICFPSYFTMHSPFLSLSNKQEKTYFNIKKEQMDYEDENFYNLIDQENSDTSSIDATPVFFNHPHLQKMGFGSIELNSTLMSSTPCTSTTAISNVPSPSNMMYLHPLYYFTSHQEMLKDGNDYLNTNKQNVDNCTPAACMSAPFNFSSLKAVYSYVDASINNVIPLNNDVNNKYDGYLNCNNNVCASSSNNTHNSSNNNVIYRDIDGSNSCANTQSNPNMLSACSTYSNTAPSSVYIPQDYTAVSTVSANNENKAENSQTLENRDTIKTNINSLTNNQTNIILNCNKTDIATNNSDNNDGITSINRSNLNNNANTLNKNNSEPITDCISTAINNSFNCINNNKTREVNQDLTSVNNNVSSYLTSIPYAQKPVPYHIQSMFNCLSTKQLTVAMQQTIRYED